MAASGGFSLHICGHSGRVVYTVSYSIECIVIITQRPTWELAAETPKDDQYWRISNMSIWGYLVLSGLQIGAFEALFHVLSEQRAD